MTKSKTRDKQKSSKAKAELKEPAAEVQIEQPPKKKVGRPSNYKPEFCDLVVELMSQGLSISAVAAEIGVGRQKLLDWQKTNEEFRVACEAGKELAQKWWEDLAMDVATGKASSHEVYKKANHGMIMFMMSRRFPDYYAKNQTMLEANANVNQTKTVVYKTQLAGGVLRQTKDGSESAQKANELVDSVMSELPND